MIENYYVVRYTGVFGFIKPFSAIRDELTCSQSFLTPSILNGIEQKLFPETLDQKKNSIIISHKLSHNGQSMQQEMVRARVYKNESSMGVIKRGVLIRPVLHLAFPNEIYAKSAFKQHICLTRNEDLLFPEENFICTKEEFENIPGMSFTESEDGEGLLVGFNRYDSFKEMIVNLSIK